MSDQTPGNEQPEVPPPLASTPADLRPQVVYYNPDGTPKPAEPQEPARVISKEELFFGKEGREAFMQRMNAEFAENPVKVKPVTVDAAQRAADERRAEEMVSDLKSTMASANAFISRVTGGFARPDDDAKPAAVPPVPVQAEPAQPSAASGVRTISKDELFFGAEGREAFMQRTNAELASGAQPAPPAPAKNSAEDQLAQHIADGIKTTFTNVSSLAQRMVGGLLRPDADHKKTPGPRL